MTVIRNPNHCTLLQFQACCWQQVPATYHRKGNACRERLSTKDRNNFQSLRGANNLPSRLVLLTQSSALGRARARAIYRLCTQSSHPPPHIDKRTSRFALHAPDDLLISHGETTFHQNLLHGSSRTLLESTSPFRHQPFFPCFSPHSSLNQTPSHHHYVSLSIITVNGIPSTLSHLILNPQIPHMSRSTISIVIPNPHPNTAIPTADRHLGPRPRTTGNRAQNIFPHRVAHMTHLSSRTARALGIKADRIPISSWVYCPRFRKTVRCCR
jgi:hypothetical protein